MAAAETSASENSTLTVSVAEVACTETTPGRAFRAAVMFSSQWAPIIPSTRSSRRDHATW